MKRLYGFSRLELMVVTIIFAVLAGILLDRLFYYQEAAEKADMEYRIRALKSGLRLRMATLLVEGRAQDFPSLANENPMDWLPQKPANYQGVTRRGDAEQLMAGNWYFDIDSRMLIYVIRSGDYFVPGVAGRKQVRLRINVVSNNQMSASGMPLSDTAAGVTLVLVEPYRWF
jgi:general secretion pathway protein G